MKEKRKEKKRTGWKKRFNDTYYIAHSFISQPFLKAMCDAGKDPELYKKRVNEYILHNYNYCIHWKEKESQQIHIT